jgi:hypothetical protein
MHCSPNFKTKKALREAVAAGKPVEFFQPGPFGGAVPENGEIYVAGPAEYHTWYAAITLKDGKVAKIN